MSIIAPGISFSGIITKVLVVVTLLSVVFSMYLYRTNKQLNSKVSDQATNIKSMQYGTISYKDQLGKYHSNSIQQDNSIAVLKEAKDSLSIEVLKLSKNYNIKLRNITAAGNIKTELRHDTTIRFDRSIESRDTVYELSSPPFIKETIEIKDDSLKRYLDIYNKQNLVWYTKRETIDPPKHFFLLRWFQKKHNVTYVDIINDNPFIKTTSQQFQLITK